MTGVKPLIAGRYRLDVPLASGGMGVVWRGWDTRLDRPVAVKQLRLQSGVGGTDAAAGRDRAMREARITARLHHPNAVPIYDVVEHDGQPCLIMQYLPSRSLQTALEQQGTLPPAVAARVGGEIAAALAAAHRVGIVHRDVKPGNVLLAEDGSAKITDFGISHALGDVSLTATGMLTGTPAFLAPEVARGQRATFASDVFSLGSTLYTATEGRPPFDGGDNSMAVLHRVASGRFEPPRRSGPLTPLLLRMLGTEPAGRPTMDEVVDGLGSVRDELAHSERGRADAATGATTPIRRAGAETSPTPSPMVSASATLANTRVVGRARSGHSSRRGPVLLAVMLGLVAVAAVVLLYSSPWAHQDPRGTAATTHSTAAPRSSAARTPTPSVKPRPSTSAPATRLTSSTPAKSSPSPARPVGIRITQALTDYYALLPRDVGLGWARLTRSYQDSHAGGFQAYVEFWRQFAGVAVSDAVAQRTDAVQATITYTYPDGHTVIDQTVYRLVMTDGRWKIQDSTVLSSRRT